MVSNANTVDEYLERVPANRLLSLVEIRNLCNTLLKNHQETMKFNMPSYQKEGEVSVAFASQKQHITVYFLIHQVMLNNQSRLKDKNHGKSCIRFSNPSKVDFQLLEHLLLETSESEEAPC